MKAKDCKKTLLNKRKVHFGVDFYPGTDDAYHAVCLTGQR